MQITIRWLTRRFVAGATVPLLAAALAAPATWAQQSTSDEASTETASSTSDDESQDDSNEQETNDAKSDQSTTTRADRDASSKSTTSGRDTGAGGTGSRSQSDEAYGPELGTRRDARDTASSGEQQAREAAQKRLQRTGEQLRQGGSQPERDRDTSFEARQDARQGVRDARDTARDATRDARNYARDTARDARDYARDTRRDTRDELQDTRRDTRQWARDTTQEMRDDRRQQGDFRGELRDFARDTARDAADYGRRAVRDALDDTRDTSQRDWDGGRQDDFRRGERQFADEQRDFQDSRDAFRDDRDTFRGDTFRDSRDDFARDSFRERDQRDFRDFRDTRDFRDDFRTQRDSFVDSRSQDLRNTRVTRSQIDNFRAASVSARDLGLSLARTSRGLIVDDVRSGALASAIGLRADDRIVAIQDYRVTSEDQFVSYLFDEDWRYDRVAVWVVRNGREVPIYVRPAQLIERLIVVQDDYDPLHTFGVVLDDRYDDELVIRRVLPNTVAFRAGLRPGDVILRFYGQRLSSPRQFVQVINRVDVAQAPIIVERDRRLREFQVSVPAELRTTSQRRTTYRRESDGRQFDDRFDTRTDTQWRGQAGPAVQYGGPIYQDTYGTPGVITTQPSQPVYEGQFQPVQPVQPGNRVDDDRWERPRILPRVFGR